ncbi:ROK family protein [Pseudomonas sp. SO81]|uniref:ROK family protein n=1 Tax=Pseudomonas sp. SO81 TaxID=2983246 RepID=UPI0025A4874B|nr:ROK family protein [Pseudomonas sp. SO81]
MNTLPFQSAVGVDLGGTKLLIRYRDHSFRFDTGPMFGAADLTKILNSFIDAYTEPGCVIGIAIPGLIENDSVAACDVLPGLVGWSARTLIDSRISRTWLVNDAKAALHATALDLPIESTAIAVMAGTAIGCGIMVNGHQLLGAHGWAGELGYWPIQTSVSQWLRLDEVAGGRYMANRLGVDGNQLALLGRQGNQAALDVISQGGHALGGVLGGLINLFNPHRLSVGGGALWLPGYWTEAQAQIDALAIPSMLASCEIRTVHGVEDLVAMGAAQIALKTLC